MACEDFLLFLPTWLWSLLSSENHCLESFLLRLRVHLSELASRLSSPHAGLLTGCQAAIEGGTGAQVSWVTHLAHLGVQPQLHWSIQTEL